MMRFICALRAIIQSVSTGAYQLFVFLQRAASMDRSLIVLRYDLVYNTEQISFIRSKIKWRK